VLQVVPGKGEYYQFKIVEQQVERQKNGTLRKGTVVEMWSWARLRRYICNNNVAGLGEQKAALKGVLCDRG
jgi:hypothetical protein